MWNMEHWFFFDGWRRSWDFHVPQAYCSENSKQSRRKLWKSTNIDMMQIIFPNFEASFTVYQRRSFHK